MSTLLVRLAAPMQAWGIDSKFDIRQTGREPSKSGVLGLLAAALGARRDDDLLLEKLSSLRFGVRVDQEGTLLRDFHMVLKDEKTSYLTHRYYLSDAVFLVGLESDDEAFLQELNEALHHPVFPLYLGRRSCPPSLPLALGIRSAELQETLQREPWQVSEWRKEQWHRWNEDKLPQLRLLTDAEPSDSSSALQKDVPVSFDPSCRKYRYRGVTAHGFIDLHDEEQQNLYVTTHDAMGEL